jgi:hypothetical protein
MSRLQVTLSVAYLAQSIRLRTVLFETEPN